MKPLWLLLLGLLSCRSIQDQHEDTWRKVIAPVVQIKSANSIGSGVILKSIERSDGYYDNYLITCWHLVDDLSIHNGLVTVKLFDYYGSYCEGDAYILESSDPLDLALLVFQSLKPIATFAEVSYDEISMFDEVYLVGCPIGLNVLFTKGEVSMVPFQNKVHINADGYVGNSGGGIFNKRTLKLMGIYDEIHIGRRDEIIEHLGAMTPITVIVKWLKSTEYSFVLEN